MKTDKTKWTTLRASDNPECVQGRTDTVTDSGKAPSVDWKRLAFSSINRNQTVHQFLRDVDQSEKPVAFDAWVSAVKEIQRKDALPNVELFDDPQHNGQYYGA